MSTTVTGAAEGVRTVAVTKATLREETVENKLELKIDRIHADRGDTVRWDVGDRVVSIWFPDSGVFVTPLLAVQHKGVIEATIRSDAQNGLYEYVIRTTANTPGITSIILGVKRLEQLEQAIRALG